MSPFGLHYFVTYLLTSSHGFADLTKFRWFPRTVSPLILWFILCCHIFAGASSHGIAELTKFGIYKRHIASPIRPIMEKQRCSNCHVVCNSEEYHNYSCILCQRCRHLQKCPRCKRYLPSGCFVGTHQHCLVI